MKDKFWEKLPVWGMVGIKKCIVKNVKCKMSERCSLFVCNFQIFAIANFSVDVELEIQVCGVGYFIGFYQKS